MCFVLDIKETTLGQLFLVVLQLDLILYNVLLQVKQSE